MHVRHMPPLDVERIFVHDIEQFEHLLLDLELLELSFSSLT